LTELSGPSDLATFECDTVASSAVPVPGRVRCGFGEFWTHRMAIALLVHKLQHLRCVPPRNERVQQQNNDVGQVWQSSMKLAGTEVRTDGTHGP
jgi:hypothetical protein